MGLGISLGLSITRPQFGSGFLPSLAPGLVADWDFTDASKLYTDSGTTLVTSNADVVGQVNDKSGNGYHLRQTDGTAKPTYRTNQLNGFPVVRFDGVNDHLDSISSNSVFQFLHDSVSTIYMVIKIIPADPNAFCCLLDNLTVGTSVGSRYGMRCQFDDRASVPINNRITQVVTGNLSNSLVNASATNYFSTQAFGLLSFIADPLNATVANRSYIRKNGGTAFQNNASTGSYSSGVDSTYPLTVGAAAGDAASPVNADFARILIYNQQHGDTDRQYIENGLIARYAIS